MNLKHTTKSLFTEEVALILKDTYNHAWSSLLLILNMVSVSMLVKS